MREDSLSISNDNSNKSGTSVAELRLRMAEYIVTKDDYYRTADVRSILTETKVGAWRRSTIVNRLRTIFSAD